MAEVPTCIRMGWAFREQLERKTSRQNRNERIASQQSTHVCGSDHPERRTNMGSTRANMSDLSPFLDNHGLLRVGGRLSNAPLKESARHPVISRLNSEITRLVVADSHQVFHLGLERTPCHLRERYWAPKMRSAVKRMPRRRVSVIPTDRHRSHPEWLIATGTV